jgi:hypothetical protein
MSQPTITELIESIRTVCRLYETSTDKVAAIWRIIEKAEKKIKEG